MRLQGVMDIAFDDTGSVERDAHALFEATINIQAEDLESADPDTYGPRNFFPGERAWSSSASYNEVVLDNLTRQEAQTELEALHQARTRFSITFTSNTGTTYASTAYIAELSISSGDQQVLRVSMALVGSAALVQTVPDPVVVVPAVTDVFYITDPAGTDAELRKLTI